MKRLSIVIVLLSLIITGCASNQANADQGDIKPTSTSSQTSGNNTYELPETSLSFKDANTFKASEDTNMALYKVTDPSGKEYIGFVNTRTGEVIAPVFDDYSRGSSFFDWGLEPVKMNDKWAYLSSSGKLMTDSIYDSASEFVVGHAIVEQYGTFGIVDSRFVNKVPFQYDSIFYDPQLGYVLQLTKPDGVRYGYYSTDTNYIVKAIYKDALVFKGNYAIGYDPSYEKYEILSRQGTVIASILEKIEYAFTKDDANFYTYEKDGLYGLIKVSDNTFEYISDTVYTSLTAQEDAFLYTIGHEEGILLRDGHLIETKNMDIREVGSTKHDYIRIVSQDKTFFIDREGRRFLESDFQEATDSNALNYAVCTRDNTQYLINMDGTVIYETKNTSPRLLSDTLVAFTDTKEGTTLIYDTKEATIITENLKMVFSELDHIEGISDEGVTLVSLEGELLLGPIKGYDKEEYPKGYLKHIDGDKNYYLTDLDGKLLSDEKYTVISKPNEDGYRQVRQGYRQGIANEDGSISVPCIYQYAYPLTDNRALVIDNFDETPKVDIIQMP